MIFFKTKVSIFFTVKEINFYIFWKTFIYNKDIKMLTDMWAIYFWISKLELLDIRYTLLPKSFCIYQYAIKNPTEPWTFHTDFETQKQASHLIRKDIQ